MEGSSDVQDLIMCLIGCWVATVGAGLGLAKYLIARSDRKHDELLKRIAELYAKTERDKVELYARMDRDKADLFARMDRDEADLDARMDRDKADLDGRMDRHRADLGTRMNDHRAGLDGRMERDKTELHARMDRDKADLHMRLDRFEGRILAQFSEVRGELRQLTRKTSVLEGVILGRTALRDEPVGVAAQQVPEETDPTEPQG